MSVPVVRMSRPRSTPRLTLARMELSRDSPVAIRPRPPPSQVGPGSTRCPSRVARGAFYVPPVPPPQRHSDAHACPSPAKYTHTRPSRWAHTPKPPNVARPAPMSMSHTPSAGACAQTRPPTSIDGLSSTRLSHARLAFSSLESVSHAFTSPALQSTARLFFTWTAP